MSTTSVGRIRMESFKGKFSCVWTIDNFSKMCIEDSSGRSYDSEHFHPLDKKMGRNWNLVACPDLEVTSSNKTRAYVDVYLHVREFCRNTTTFRCTFQLVDYFSYRNPVAVEKERRPRNQRIGVRFRLGSSWPITLPDDELKVLVEVNYECDTSDLFYKNLSIIGDATPRDIANNSPLSKKRKNGCVAGSNREDVCVAGSNRGDGCVAGSNQGDGCVAGSNQGDGYGGTSRDAYSIDLEPDVTTSLLQFLSSGRVDRIDVEVFLKLLEASRNYEMPDLNRYCVDYLADRIDAKNVVRLAIEGDRLDASVLKEKAMRYFAENFYSIDLEDHRAELEQKPAIALDIMKTVQDRGNKIGKRVSGPFHRIFKR